MGGTLPRRFWDRDSRPKQHKLSASNGLSASDGEDLRSVRVAKVAVLLGQEPATVTVTTKPHGAAERYRLKA